MEGANIIMVENMDPALLAVLVVASMGAVLWGFVAVSTWLFGINDMRQKEAINCRQRAARRRAR